MTNDARNERAISGFGNLLPGCTEADISDPDDCETEEDRELRDADEKFDRRSDR